MERGQSVSLIDIYWVLLLTGSLKMTGKSKRGKSMYKNKFSDFSVSAYGSVSGRLEYYEGMTLIDVLYVVPRPCEKQAGPTSLTLACHHDDTS